MRLSALASGSSGNCYYIENKDSAVLIDAGITARQINERLSQLGKTSKNIKAIFITHEHIDHVRGVDVFARQLNIPIFATKGTIKNCFLCSNESLVNPIKNNENLKIGNMEVQAFSKSHDASDPVSYSITNSKKISIITDLGKVCKRVIENVSDSHFLCFESNHDEEMLQNGPYPYYLKERISSEKGHLSNKKASLCILEHASPKLKQVVLSHLSQINNTPKLALGTFNSLIKERSDLSLKSDLSLRECPTQLFKI